MVSLLTTNPQINSGRWQALIFFVLTTDWQNPAVGKYDVDMIRQKSLTCTQKPSVVGLI